MMYNFCEKPMKRVNHLFSLGPHVGTRCGYSQVPIRSTLVRSLAGQLSVEQ